MIGDSHTEVMRKMKAKLVRILATAGSIAAMIVAGSAQVKIG
jgi:hypothetical protein